MRICSRMVTRYRAPATVMWTIRLTNCAAESRTWCTCCNHGNTCTCATTHNSAVVSRVRLQPLSASEATDKSRGGTLIFGGHLAEKEDRVSGNVEMYCYVHAARGTDSSPEWIPKIPQISSGSVFTDYPCFNCEITLAFTNRKYTQNSRDKWCSQHNTAICKHNLWISILGCADSCCVFS